MSVVLRTLNDQLSQPSQTGPKARSTRSAPNSATRLDGGQRYVVCAFYTPSYRAHVARLRASLERLGVNYHLREYEERLTWEAATRIKPKFLRECMDRFINFDILYVDADAVLREAPEFFNEVSSDVALLFAPVRARRKRALSIAAGTLYVRQTPGGGRFVDAWNAQIERAGPVTCDEDMIYMAFPSLAGVSFTALPQSYSKIFDSPGPVAVIEHFQASRNAFRLRRWVRRLARVGIVSAIVALAALAWIFPKLI